MAIIKIFDIKSEFPVSLGVVDNCIVIRFPEINKSFASSELIYEGLGLISRHIASLDFSKSILDLRNTNIMYDDLLDFIDFLPGDTVFAVSSNNQKKKLGFRDDMPVIISPKLYTKQLVLPMELAYIITQLLGFSNAEYQMLISQFNSWPPNMHLGCINVDSKVRQILEKWQFNYKLLQDDLLYSEYDDLKDNAVYECINYILKTFLNELACESPLIQLAFQFNCGEIKCNHYHTGAVYKTIADKKEIFLSRPSILAKRTCLILKDQIAIFENLINDPFVKERDLQDFFEQYPNFLLGSEYEALYPQIFLQREGDSHLIPDFILQPAGVPPWSDILDLKLPTEKLVVGTKNRRRLSKAFYDGMAQLRKYATYFENPKNREKIINKLGIHCYEPRLILAIGRYTHQLNDLNIKKELSKYSNQKLLTYDEILEHAKRRLLL